MRRSRRRPHGSRTRQACKGYSAATPTALVALFGPADQDHREPGARRLQFVGPACVLDAYLYAKGSGPAVVTWLDARTPEARISTARPASRR
jgi:hypothetical protein